MHQFIWGFILLPLYKINPMLKIGHHGDAGYEPENTL
jgi:hypothetical protein